MQRERKVFILNKKYKHIDIITKPIVAILIAALLVTNAPEFFTKKIVAAESTWKILSLIHI